MLPLTVVTLAPLASAISRAVVSEIAPVPLVARSLVAFGRLIVPPALAIRFLAAARLTAPAKMMVLKGLAAEPIVKLAVKSGKAFTVIASAALPGLIVIEPVGLAKSVVSNVAALSRERPLPRVPSSPSVATFGPGGRLKKMSLAVPVFEIGSRPV